jgi:AcrR family transcriptional regulator
MSTGHILYHFGRKDRLLVEVLKWSEHDLTEGFRGDLARLRSPRRKLESFIVAYLPKRMGDERWALWAQVYARPPEDEESRRLLDSCVQTWEELLATIVRGVVGWKHLSDGDVEEFVIRSRAMLDGLSMEIISGSLRLTLGSARAFALRAMEGELGALST